MSTTTDTRDRSIVSNIITQVSSVLSADPTGGLPTDGVGDCDISKDAIFDLLANPRRRTLVRMLAEEADIVRRDALVKRRAAVEQGVAIDELSREARKRVYVSYYQTHLPKLEEHDVVSVEEDFIAPARNLDALWTILELSENVLEQESESS